MKYYLLIFHLILCNTLKVDSSESTYEPNSNRNLISNNDGSKKNLIIAVISNCDWNNMAIFFKSYEKAHFENTDLIIFANKLKGKAKEKMKSYATEIYPIPDEYTKISTENSRWKIYSDFLNKNKNLYNQVFTTDIKTTFFQKDIFKYYDNKKIKVNKEYVINNGINSKVIVLEYKKNSALLKNIRTKEYIFARGMKLNSQNKLEWAFGIYYEELSIAARGFEMYTSEFEEDLKEQIEEALEEMYENERLVREDIAYDAWRDEQIDFEKL